MIGDIARMGELPGAIGQVGGIRAQILGLGDPYSVAGNPGTLRVLANAHRDVASGLQSILTQGQGAVSRIGGLWQGPASESFSGFWGGFNGQVDGLASRHLQMAGSLDAIAGQAERINQDVTGSLAAMESWLRSAAAALATMDAGAVPGLVAQVPGLVSRWGTVLARLEAFANGLGPQVEIELLAPLPAFSGFSAEPWPQEGWPGLILDPVPPHGPGTLITTVPEPEPSILITTPGPSGPTILITTVPPQEPGILITTLPPAGPWIIANKSEGEPPPENGDGQPNPPEPGEPQDEPKIPPGSMPADQALPRLAGGDKELEGELSKNFHRIKRGAGLGGSASTRIDPRTGEVYITSTGEDIGNVWDG